ncbi:hypothetical protein QQF64_000509 [Cirrhinus molitorella]|uniref:Uncharacterized protein n=1 Tax=Cirrhinus molitorella TaxID=172907 RepID=A0ABR3NYQ0_9TELE
MKAAAHAHMPELKSDICTLTCFCRKRQLSCRSQRSGSRTMRERVRLLAFILLEGCWETKGRGSDGRSQVQRQLFGGAAEGEEDGWVWDEQNTM